MMTVEVGWAMLQAVDRWALPLARVRFLKKNEDSRALVLFS